MTPFEFAYATALPVISPLNVLVRRTLRRELRDRRRAELLDVGGRKSPYTAGLAVAVTVTELPRATAVQEELNLGLTAAQATRLVRRRSNVRGVVFDDMTRSTFAPGSADVVTAVEVLEHVEEDEAFVANVARVLRPGGAFVMTTPNGDAIPVPHNADHKRHYRREQLAALLGRHFAEVEVHYAVRQSAFRRAGLRPWSARRPLRTLGTIVGNLGCLLHSSLPGASADMDGTRHLLAVARRPSPVRTDAPPADARVPLGAGA